MTGALPSLAHEWHTMGEALLIALIIGIQRESDSEELHAGIRDFLLIGLAGGICGILQNTAISAAVLLSITGLLAIFRLQTPGRTGITTEIACVSTFLLTLLTADLRIPYGQTLAIGLTILAAFLLKARDALRKLAREEITAVEFSDTLLFLAVVFVIYPVLPEGSFGPFGFFNPRTIWMFVILVSSITYAGYFLQKFLGVHRGLRLTAILGGLASTTAATLSFSRDLRDTPDRFDDYARATILANAIQFPRLFVLLLAVSPLLARDSAVALLVATLAGWGAGWLLTRGAQVKAASSAVKVRNPFRFVSALKMGGIFTAVLFAVRWVSETAGTQAILVSSAVGGSLDLDAAVLSLAELRHTGRTAEEVVQAGVALAAASNALVKTGIAFVVGGARLGWRLLAAFAAMFTGGGLAWWVFS